MNKKIGMMAGAVILAGAVGTGVYHTEASSGKEPELITAATLSTEEAQAKLQEEYQGTIKELELDEEGNKLYYEAEIIGVDHDQEYEVKMDAETGEIVKEQVEGIELEEKQSGENAGNKNDAAPSQHPDYFIDARHAIDIATEAFGGTVVKYELDRDDGRMIYELELYNHQQEAEMDIDAKTGKILFMEIDQEDD